MEDLFLTKYKAAVFDRIKIYDKAGDCLSVSHPSKSGPIGENYARLSTYRGIRGFLENPRNKERPLSPCTIYHLPYEGMSRFNEYVLLIFDEPTNCLNPCQYFKYIIRDENKKKIINGALLEVYTETPTFEKNYEAYYQDDSSYFCSSPGRRHPWTTEETVDFVNNYVEEHPDTFADVKEIGVPNNKKK